MTIDHVPTLDSVTFECIFGPLSHIATDVGLDRLLGSKTQLFEIKYLMGQTNANFKELFFSD